MAPFQLFQFSDSICMCARGFFLEATPWMASLMLVTTKLTSEFDFNACLWNVTLADDDRAIQRPISLCLFFFLSLWPNSSSGDEHHVFFFRINIIIVCKITFSAALHIIHILSDFRKYWLGLGKFFFMYIRCL